jgi:hypothetical protein
VVRSVATAGVVLPGEAKVAMGAHQRERMLDFGARAAVAALFTLLAGRIGADFLATRRFTGLLLLSSELLVIVLTVIRRRAVAVDRSVCGRLLTALSIAGPPLVAPSAGGGFLPDAWTAAAAAAGLFVIIGGKLSLGRSFGLVPANRGVVVHGLYRAVRHPIYAGYLLTHAAFLAAHPTAWNAAVLFVADLALVGRARQEERVLATDAAYAAYAARVRWRFVPGIY